jgi:hypothetical protein
MREKGKGKKVKRKSDKFDMYENTPITYMSEGAMFYSMEISTVFRR